MISLTPISPDQQDAVRRLAVAPEQADFVASNAESLAEAAQRPECVPLAIHAGQELVGFAVYALDPDDGRHWIYRLMIDARFQGRGHGGAALAALLELMAGLPGCSLVKLGVAPANHRAARLYERLGFRPNGEIIDGETILVHEFAAR